MEIPQYIKTSELYGAQYNNDPNNIVFHPNYSDFTPNYATLDDLIRHIHNYGYWQVNEIDPAFYKAYKIHDKHPLLGYKSATPYVNKQTSQLWNSAKPTFGDNETFKILHILCSTES